MKINQEKCKWRVCTGMEKETFWIPPDSVPRFFPGFPHEYVTGVNGRWLFLVGPFVLALEAFVETFFEVVVVVGFGRGFCENDGFGLVGEGEGVL